MELIVALQLAVAPISAVMNERSGMGRTGETYLVGPDHKPRSDTDLERQPFSLSACLADPESCTRDTESIRQALGGKTGQRMGLDYRGKEVLSAFAPVNVWGDTWALITEIDTTEAYAALGTFTRIAFFLAALSILGIVAISLFMVQHFARPISRLIEGTEQLKARRFDFKVHVRSNDELELLADTFNAMVDEIRVYSENLEQKISLLQEAEAAVKNSEQQLRAIINNARAVIYLKDLDGRFLMINNRFETLFGVTDESVRGLTDHDLFPVELADAFRRNDMAVLGSNNAMEIEEMAPHGDELHTYISVKFPLRDASGQPYAVCGISTDITDRKRAEEEKLKLVMELRQAHKMEAIGTLAGGIAHDFNNILGIVLGNTELAIEDVPQWSPAHDSLKEVRSATLRARDVVRQLLSFSRKRPQEMKPVDIIPVIRDSVKFLRASIPSHIEIRTHLPEQCQTILADETQIHQIIMNLMTNADHAMPDGGIIDIAVDDIAVDEAGVRGAQDLKAGWYVRLRISDTGHGVTPEVIERIFDPYFTTKEVGKGTGMGLAVVHGIVKGHNGSITVQSEPGRGSRFSVYLPAIDRLAVPEPEAEEKLPSGGERVLFVDDEAAIVKMACTILQRLGYQAEGQTNPIDALERFRSRPDRFDLVITDQSMPGMTGDLLIRAILSERPDMPVILCTGYSEKIDTETARAIGAAGYMEKPLDKRAFALAVRNVLDGEPISNHRGAPV